jgi:perosamine synthetase
MGVGSTTRTPSIDDVVTVGSGTGPPPGTVGFVEPMIEGSASSGLHGRTPAEEDLATLPVAGPWITDAEVNAVLEAVQGHWYERSNDGIRAFEQAFATAVGRAHAISLPSCTSGLHLSLLALGVGPGDEVVVPDATWIATSAPISYVGASPVFADVDPVHWCLTVEALERVVSDRTKAVIAVDLYGSCGEVGDIEAFCDARGIALVEDAAEAAGAIWCDRPAGNFGVTSVFSFHGSKTLTTGEGGMVVTDDDALHERMAFLRDHGRAPGDVQFTNLEVAYKYKMGGLQAALGRVQLARLEELVGRKRHIFKWYLDRLGGIPGLTMNGEPAGTRNAYWMSTVVLDPDLGWAEPDLAPRLRDLGVATRPFFHPLSSLPAYAGSADAGRAQGENVVSARLGRYGLNLPSALRLDERDVDRACATLLGLLRG